MRRWIPMAVGVLACAVLTGSAAAQVTLTAQDIPMDAGQSMYFAIEVDTSQFDSTGIPVTITPPGGNQEWEFISSAAMGFEADSLFDPATSTWIDSFPNANRGVEGGSLFGFQGLGDGSLQRFERVVDAGWSLQGVLARMAVPNRPEPLVIPLAFRDSLLITPLPLEMGMEWNIADTLSTIYTDDSTGLEFLVEFAFGGMSDADAWGNATFAGGEAPCLRVHTVFGGELNVYPMIFGIPSPIPIYTQLIPASQSYSWVAPGWGEIATITSLPGEENELFDQASLVRYRTTAPTSAGDAERELPLSFHLDPVVPNPFNASTTVSFTLEHAGRVRVDVFDLLGRRVATLAEGAYTRGGHHVAWQADGLSSGVYLVRLTAGGASQTVRASLIK